MEASDAKVFRTVAYCMQCIGTFVEASDAMVLGLYLLYAMH